MAKLVDATHILCGTRISFEKIDEANGLLTSFSDSFEDLYGEINSVSNVHILRHLADCVKFIGPLFAYSNYHFEDYIGHLVSLHKGTTDVTSQIAEKYLLEKNLFFHLASSPIVKDFCEDIDKKHKFSVCRKVDGCIVIGKPKKKLTLNDHEKTLILSNLKIANDAKIEEYDSMLLNCKVFYETIDKPCKRTDDSFIYILASNKFARIKSIFVIHEKLFLLADEKYEVLSDSTNKCKSIRYLKESEVNHQSVLRPTSVGPKFALVQFENIITCAEFPNMHERD